MELLHVDEVRPARDAAEMNVKRIFGSIRDFDELVDKFVFYTPVVHHLIGDAGRITIPTDIISHTLAHVMREHPLIVTDLPRNLFRFDERLAIASDLKSFRRTLYAVPTAAWQATISRLRMLSVFDRTTGRFCVLTPHRRHIRNPIGSHPEYLLPIRYFNCYGNRETWCFADDDPVRTQGGASSAVEPPVLCYHPPIREFVEIAVRALRSLRPVAGTPMEDAVRRAAVETDRRQDIMRILEIRQANDLHARSTTPLNESSLDEQYIRECRDIIRFHESVFGSTD